MNHRTPSTWDQEVIGKLLERDKEIAALKVAIAAAREEGRAAGYAEAIENAAGIMEYERNAIGEDDRFARRAMSRTMERVRALAPAATTKEPK